MTNSSAMAAWILLAATGAAANGWIEVTPGGTVPAERIFHAAVWAPAASGFYIFAGEARGYSLDDLQFYDRESNQWSQLTPSGTTPDIRQGHTLVWADGADGFYLFGGWGRWGYVTKLHFYDRQANQWIEVTPSGTVPAGRQEHAAVWAPAAGGFYVHGGEGDDGVMNDLNFYDRQANQWIELAPGGAAPGYLYRHTMVWAPEADGFYVFGGWGDGGYRNKLHFYDRQANQWIEVTPSGTVPTERSRHAAVWAPGLHGFYVSGGSGDPRDRGWFIDLYFYDHTANKWSEVTAAGQVPDWREGHTMVWVPLADGFYVFGGYGGRYMNELHFFDRQFTTSTTTSKTITSMTTTKTSRTMTTGTTTSMTMTTGTTTSGTLTTIVASSLTSTIGATSLLLLCCQI